MTLTQDPATRAWRCVAEACDAPAPPPSGPVASSGAPSAVLEPRQEEQEPQPLMFTIWPGVHTGSMKHLVRRLPVFVGVMGRVDTREVVTGLWELATRLVSRRWASTAGKLQARAHCALVGEAAIWAALLAAAAALSVAGLVANVAGTALLSWVYLAGVEAAASCAAWPVYLARVRWAPLDVVVNSTTAAP